MLLNIQRLEVKPNKDYAEVVFLGDTHFGSKFSDKERAERMVEHCLKNHIYVMCMGD